MNGKYKIIAIMICIVIVIIVISAVTLIILRIQSDKNAPDIYGNYPDEYGDYPDYGEIENQNFIAEDVEEDNVEEEDFIQYSEENYYDKVKISNQQMAEKYFIDYRDNRLYFPEEAYNSLKENYKNRRFPTYEEYAQYIEENRVQIASSGLKQYTISEENGKNVYTCVDQNNNYYVFVEEAIMQYTVREGKYEPEPEGFAEEYESSLEETKVMRNINRFVAMINNREYDMAYKVLNTAFKETYFPTEEEFENYIVDNFFNDNNVQFNTMPEQVEGVYTAEAELINREDDEADTKKYVFEVTLLEGTEYTLSFQIE